jgi:hypothetical protein
MGRIRFLYDNVFDSGVLFASSAVPTLPVRYLQDIQRSKPWRASGCANEYVDVQLPTPTWCNALVVDRHNLTPDGIITIQAGVSQGDNSLLDLSLESWEPIVGWGEFDWGDRRFDWMGWPAREDIRGRAMRWFYFDGAPATWWRIGFQDPTNPKGFVQAGRIFLGCYWSPAVNFFWPYKIYPVDPSITDYSLGGNPRGNELDQYWMGELPFERVANQDVWWGFQDLFQLVGTKKDFYLDPHPDSPMPSKTYFTRLYGRLTELPQMEFGDFDRGEHTISIRESL